MDRIEPEAFRFFCPLFADELVRCEPLDGLEPAAEVVGGNEVVKVLSELGMIFVVIALDRRRVCRRKATMIASSSTVRTVDLGCLGPVRSSARELRLRHLATVFGLMP